MPFKRHNSYKTMYYKKETEIDSNMLTCQHFTNGGNISEFEESKMDV